jgi:DNA-binding transcriptional LysR family regulator
MNIHHLRYFVQVIESKSYTKAAKLLMVSQPVLSRTISQIEKELDVELIQRSSKRFRITDAGEVLYQQALEVLQSHKNIYQRIEDLKSTDSAGQVSLSTPGVLLDIYFPQLLFQFYKKHPHIKIDVITEGSKQTVQSVFSNQAELGLVMLPISKSFNLESDIVTTSVVQLLVNKKHRFAQRKSVHISELEEERIITFNSTTTLYGAFVSRCEAEGFSPNIVYKTLMPTFIFEMVSLNHCIAVLPNPVIEKYITEELFSIPLEPLFEWEIAVVRKKEHYHSFAARHLFSFMQEYFSRLGN